MWPYTSFVSFYLACKIYFPCCESISAPVLKLCWQLCVKVSFCVFHRDSTHLFIPTGASLERFIFILIHFLYYFFSQLGQQSSLSCNLGIILESAVKQQFLDVDVSRGHGRINSRKIFSMLCVCLMKYLVELRGMNGEVLKTYSRLFCNMCPVPTHHISESGRENSELVEGGESLVRKFWG